MGLLKNLAFFYRKYLQRNPYGWSGNYTTWQQAQQQCSGYDAGNILQKVKAATLQVKRGEAVFERDAVLFDRIEYSWPLVAALMWVAAKNNGRLKVIDFGGSLGSSYFQNKGFLDTLSAVQWNVIEQHNFVTAGRESIQDDQLRFYYNVEECIQQQGIPDILLLCCTLPYIQKPYELLAELLSHSIPHILIDNTPFNNTNADRLTIQKVPPSIYSASYPCWFLNYEKIKKMIAGKYTISSEHTNDTVIYLDGNAIPYKGLLATLKTQL